MSFESKMKNRGNKNLNKFAKNPYHVSWIKRLPLWSKIAVPATLVAACSSLVVVIALPKTRSNKSVIQDSVPLASNINSTPDTKEEPAADSPKQAQPSSQASSLVDTAVVVPWENRAINDKYRLLSYNNANYASYLYPAIEQEYIGELLEDSIVMKGEEVTYENDDTVVVSHETTASLYKINHFSQDLIVAVKFQEDDGYYWYKNVSNQEQYQNLGVFLNKVDLSEAATFMDGFYDYVDGNKRVRYQYQGLSKEQVINTVFVNPNAPFLKEVELPNGETKYYSQYSNYISVPIYIPMLHLETSSNGASGFSIYDNGFMELTFMNKKDWFYLGEDSYQTFKDYLTNLTGELLPNYYPN